MKQYLRGETLFCGWPKDHEGPHGRWHSEPGAAPSGMTALEGFADDAVELAAKLRMENAALRADVERLRGEIDCQRNEKDIVIAEQERQNAALRTELDSWKALGFAKPETIRTIISEAARLAKEREERVAKLEQALQKEFARGRLDEFERMKKERPADPIYWDYHEEKELRAALAQPDMKELTKTTQGEQG